MVYDDFSKWKEVEDLECVLLIGRDFGVGRKSWREGEKRYIDML